MRVQRYEHVTAGGFGLRHHERNGGESLGEGTQKTLLCFPHVGGASTSFRPLADRLPEGWRLVAVDPPGRPPCPPPALERFDALIAAYDAHLPRALTAGAVVFGYSLGAYVALALAALRPEIARVVIAAAAPHHRRMEQPSFLASGADLMQRVIELGGIAPAVAAERDLLEMMEPVIRADFAAYESCPIPAAPLARPALVIGGTEDRLVEPKHLDEWNRYVSPCRVERVPGGHFFLQSNADRIAELVYRDGS